MYSPVPIENAPATSAAAPVSITVCADTPPPASPEISEAFVTSPSTAPNTVGRNQPPETSRCPCDQPATSAADPSHLTARACHSVSPCTSSHNANPANGPPRYLVGTPFAGGLNIMTGTVANPNAEKFYGDDYTMAIISGSLPPGLRLSLPDTEWTVTGTPTKAGTYPQKLTITITIGTGSSDRPVVTGVSIAAGYSPPTRRTVPG
jgi:hypothetical protein